MKGNISTFLCCSTTKKTVKHLNRRLFLLLLILQTKDEKNDFLLLLVSPRVCLQLSHTYRSGGEGLSGEGGFRKRAWMEVWRKGCHEWVWQLVKVVGEIWLRGEEVKIKIKLVEVIEHKKHQMKE